MDVNHCYYDQDDSKITQRFRKTKHTHAHAHTNAKSHTHGFCKTSLLFDNYQ